jgi:hypothetical protein
MKSGWLLLAGGLIVACSSGGGGSGGASGSCTSDCDARAIVEGGQVNAVAIAVAKDNVYWGSEPQGGHPNVLRRVAPAGGPVSDVLTDNAGLLKIGSNGAAVFAQKDGALVRLDAGTSSSVVLVAKPGGSSIDSIAANATFVYWSNGTDILRVPVAGGAPETIYSTVRANNIAIDDQYVYFSESINNSLQAVAIDGPAQRTPRTLAAQHDGMKYAVWNGTAYFASQRDKTIKSVPVTGGEPTLLAQTDAEPLVLAVDGSGIFYGTQEGLSRVSLAGGASAHVGPVDAQSHMVTDIAFDDTYVYWIDYSYQAIRRVAK